MRHLSTRFGDLDFLCAAHDAPLVARTNTWVNMKRTHDNQRVTRAKDPKIIIAQWRAELDQLPDVERQVYDAAWIAIRERIQTQRLTRELDLRRTFHQVVKERGLVDVVWLPNRCTCNYGPGGTGTPLYFQLNHRKVPTKCPNRITLPGKWLVATFLRHYELSVALPVCVDDDVWNAYAPTCGTYEECLQHTSAHPLKADWPLQVSRTLSEPRQTHVCAFPDELRAFTTHGCLVGFRFGWSNVV